MTDLWLVSYVVLWVLVALLAFMVVGLLRQLGLIQIRLGPEPGALITDEGLPRGRRVPNIESIDLVTGASLPLLVGDEVDLLMLFVSPTCDSCRVLMPQVTDIARTHRDKVSVRVVCSGAEAACREFAAQFGVRVPVFADVSGSIADAFEVKRSPFAYLVGPNGDVLVRGVVNSWPQIESLLRQEGTLQGTLRWHQNTEQQGSAFDSAQRTSAFSTEEVG